MTSSTISGESAEQLQRSSGQGHAAVQGRGGGQAGGSQTGGSVLPLDARREDKAPEHLGPRSEVKDSGPTLEPRGADVGRGANAVLVQLGQGLVLGGQGGLGVGAPGDGVPLDKLQEQEPLKQPPGTGTGGQRERCPGSQREQDRLVSHPFALLCKQELTRRSLMRPAMMSEQ